MNLPETFRWSRRASRFAGNYRTRWWTAAGAPEGRHSSGPGRAIVSERVSPIIFWTAAATACAARWTRC